MKKKKISKKKASILNLIFNYGNALFAIINGLILVPIYLTHFSIGTYGSFLSSGNIVSMLGLLEGGMAYVLTQKLSISYAKRDLKEFSNLLGSGIFISFFLTILLVIVGFCLSPFISDWVKAEPSEYRNIQYAFIISAIGAGLSITFNNISSVFQAWLKVQISGSANLIAIFLGVSSTLLGLKIGLGVVSIPLGILVRSLTGVVILSIVLIKTLKKENYPQISIDKKKCIELIKSTLPLLGGGISKSLVTNSQLLIITNFINPASSAIFFITGRIFLVCDSFLAPIGSSIFSSISQIAGEGDNEKVKRNLVSIFVLFNTFSALILSMSFAMNNSFISLLVGSDKFGGFALSALMCVNMLLYTRFNFLSINLFALGIFGKTVLFDVLGGVIRIILIFSLISHIGYIAIPIAEFLSTTLLLGYFINKLIINKLNLQGTESIKFVFAGGYLIITSFLLSTTWQFIFPKPETWITFIGQSLIYSSMLSAIILVLVKETRVILYDAFVYIKEITNKNIIHNL